ncbi:MAG: adenylyl-sulfate kinase [Thermoanaerobaculia bacterium]|nr:MAG: adenylyl-sulfate kinase [Thermoanaerobaculia bacterium]
MTADRAPAGANLTRHPSAVAAADRARLLRQRGCVVWFTGLSGSGKSTLAVALEATLVAAGHVAFVLDGDNVRHGLNRDLGFAPADRTENIRRVGEVAALFADAGLVTLTAFISPARADRDAARAAVGAERFLEVFVSTPLEVCERRDPKRLYSRARAGEVGEFTGVSAPYEPPLDPALALDTSTLDAAACVERLVALLRERGFLLDIVSPAGGGAA